MKTAICRGKRKDNGEWIYGYYVEHNDKSYIYYEVPDEMVQAGNWLNSKEVIPETVGMFTGLRDTKSNTIYVGDIHKFRENHFVVKFGAYYDCENNVDLYGFYMEDLKHRRRCYAITGNESEYAVIVGNIHDNPELLKGGADNG